MKYYYDSEEARVYTWDELEQIYYMHKEELTEQDIHSPSDYIESAMWCANGTLCPVYEIWKDPAGELICKNMIKWIWYLSGEYESAEDYIAKKEATGELVRIQ